MTKLDLPTPNGWVLKKLGDSDISEILMGQSPPGSTYNNEQNGMPFFQGKKDFGEKYPTPRVWCVKPIRIAKKNDILLSVRAPVGSINWAKEDCCIGRGLCAISPKIEPYFIYYFLMLLEKKLSTSGRGGVFKAIKSNFIHEIPINIPTKIQTRKKIVQKLDDILRQLEEKKKEIFPIIEQNKQRINFFDKNWLTYIFDREIYKNAKRKEWSISTLVELPQEGNDKFTDGPFGSNMQVKDYVSSGIPIIRLQNIGISKFIDKNWKFISEKKYNELIRHSAQPGDILIAKMADPVARSTIIPPIFEKYMISADCVKLRINEEKAIPEFVSYAINSYTVRKQANSLAQGMTRSRINLREMKKLEIPLPSLPTQKQIVQNIKSVEDKFQSQKVQFENIKHNYEKTINHINYIQSSILDAAFSGKLVQ